MDSQRLRPGKAPEGSIKTLQRMGRADLNRLISSFWLNWGGLGSFWDVYQGMGEVQLKSLIVATAQNKNTLKTLIKKLTPNEASGDLWRF